MIGFWGSRFEPSSRKWLKAHFFSSSCSYNNNNNNNNNKHNNNPSTIYALSSGYGKCGVSIIRISGPDSVSVLQRMSSPTKTKKIPQQQSRLTSLRTLVDPVDKSLVLDRALVVRFKGPRSFTGEDVVELHVHGGVATVNAVLKGTFHQGISFSIRIDLYTIILSL